MTDPRILSPEERAEISTRVDTRNYFALISALLQHAAAMDEKLETARQRVAELEREKKDAVYSGVLIALANVYEADVETLAEEIVGTVGASELVRVATAEEDYILPQLKKTIAFLKSRTSVIRKQKLV